MYRLQQLVPENWNLFTFSLTSAEAIRSRKPAANPFTAPTRNTSPSCSYLARISSLRYLAFRIHTVRNGKTPRCYGMSCVRDKINFKLVCPYNVYTRKSQRVDKLERYFTPLLVDISDKLLYLMMMMTMMLSCVL